MIKTQYVITVIFTGDRKFEKVLAKNILSWKQFFWEISKKIVKTEINTVTLL